jgi:phosphomevalonate kinase
MSTTSSSTLVSAPGKVLLAGGFLVLDPQYFGIVISTSARFYTLIRPSKTTVPEGRITVRAAQFPAESSTWSYDLSFASAGPLEVKPVDEASGGNTFVQLTLQSALRYAEEVVGQDGIKEKLGHGIEVVVLADNDFYSQSDKVD